MSEEDKAVLTENLVILPVSSNSTSGFKSGQFEADLARYCIDTLPIESVTTRWWPSETEITYK